ncbi:hypothetical protein POM88_026107 [Heracleum sosnowskyi]|uniref:Uncharacterized protein n=1 Tax=Heracleum sosnowskyi TaxID=360622 RepID=A0AAD8I7L2_9APIA|nr:hypothetical protein POM88_026107 [Heracleum sosnowskyi]
MGISASTQTRVTQTLRTSSEFNSVVNSVYQDSLALTQHAFPGIKPYQLLSASDQIHASLTLINYPLVLKWVPSPPTRSQVDQAFKSITSDKPQQDITLGEDEFRDFAVDLYGNAVVSSAGKAVMVRVPVGIAGIVGVGVAMGSGNRLVKAAVGVYALGAAVAFYFGF